MLNEKQITQAQVPLMNSKEKEEIKKKIISEMKKIKEEIPALEKSSQPVAPDNSIGRLTRMEAIGTKSINEAALSSAKGRLARLEVALANIDDEDFGLCVECDEPIAHKRLLFRPESIKCIHCAQ